MGFRNIDEQCYISRSLSAQEAIDQAAAAKAELAYTTTSIIDKNVNAQPSSCCRIPLR